MKFRELARAEHVKKSEILALCVTWQQYLKGPCLVLLQGKMAAGKTEWVKQFVSQFGFISVGSPSFAIHHQYRNDQACIEHFDLFRLESDEELESVGFWDLLGDASSWVLIEWPERLNQEHLPKDRRIFRIEILTTANEPQMRDFVLSEMI